MREGRELLEYLCGKFGPTGFEAEVADAITEELGNDCDRVARDSFGNIYAVIEGEGQAPRDRVMISSHMDEVGFMITFIDDDGYIHFSNLGGIDPKVLYGKQVILGNENHRINGVIAAKAIHHKSREERFSVTPVKEMYIDIGAKDGDEVREYVNVGDFGVFNSDFVFFGTDKKYAKGKAIDDRAGCCAMIEVIRKIRENNLKLPFDVYFCFTVREEVGLSGAKVVAEKVKPSRAIILETTAIGDIAGAPAHKRVADVGEGGVVSIMDRSTIYNTEFVDFTLGTAKENGIKAQVKRYVSGGNDAGHIHKSGKGVKCVAISMGTRYLHSPACVASMEDYTSIRELVFTMLKNMKAEV
ncbi:MAG: M42 family metallopeptidase [Eubacteriales bacterium]